MVQWRGPSVPGRVRGPGSVAGQGAQARLALAQLFICQKGIIRVATSQGHSEN